MKIADFFAEIGFKVDTKSLQKFNNSMSTVVNSVRGLAFALTAAMTAWQALQTKIGQNAQTMLNFKTYTGENIDEIRKLAAVMQGTNLNFSMDTLLGDISNIKTQLRELQLFGEGSGMAQALRVVGLPGLNPGAISTVQDFLKMLRQIPDAATRTMLVERMGLSKQFLNILDLTDAQYDELAAKADKIFPDEQELKRRQKASLDIYMTWLELKNLFESKVTDFAPILNDILLKIKDIVSDSDKLAKILEGIKWFFILSTLTSIATTVGLIVANIRTLLVLLGVAAGIQLGQWYNEQHGIDNMSKRGMINQGIGGAVGGIGSGIAVGGTIWGSKKLFEHISQKLGFKQAAKAGTEGVAKTVVAETSRRAARRGVAGVAERQLSRTALRQIGRAAGRAAGGAVARQTAAGAANVNPWVAGGLAAWGLFDIGKAIFDIAKATKETDTLADRPESKSSSSTEQSNDSQSFNWSQTLSNLTINAQNVYLYANRVIGFNNGTTYTTTDYEQQQINTMRTRYSMMGNW